MATIKAYTDPSQSKALSKILPLESADGGWYGTTNPYAANTHLWLHTKYSNKAVLPAWSLAVLLGVLPNSENKSITLSRGGYRLSTLEQINDWFVDYEDEDNGFNNCATSADNPVDACVAMIEKLHELNLL